MNNSNFMTYTLHVMVIKFIEINTRERMSVRDMRETFGYNFKVNFRFRTISLMTRDKATVKTLIIVY